MPAEEDLVCLAMDYETFGEHKPIETGILSFLGGLISEIAADGQIKFTNPSELIRNVTPRGIVSTARAVSWADEERDLSAWIGNNMQKDAFTSLYKFHNMIINTGETELLSIYRYLQTSDHFYYMSTKKGADGQVHQYFSPFKSPYEAFMNFMNVISDLEFRLKSVPKTADRALTDEEHKKDKNVISVSHQ
jgi:alpha-amylase